jgi:hypothetical protein
MESFQEQAEEEDANGTLREWQQRFISILPNLSGSVSLLCSLVLLYMLFRSKQKIKTVQRRLIFGKGMADVLQSAWMALSTLPAPQGTAHVWNPRGTQATCDAQGFSIYFGTSASLLYTSAICIYYMCVIKYRMNEAAMKKYEILFHAFPILWGLVGGLILLHQGNFKPDIGWCWPSGLLDNGDAGDFFKSSAAWIILLPFIILLISMCLSMLNIYLLFHSEERQRKKSRRKREKSRLKKEEARRAREEKLRNAPPLSDCSSLDSDWNGISRANSSGDRMFLGFSEEPTGVRSHVLIRQSCVGRAAPTNNRRNTPFAMRTAFRYIASYICAFFFSFVIVILRFNNISSDYVFVFSAFAIFFYPLQGCFNFVVYFQPKYVVVRGNNMRHTVLQAIFQTINTDGEMARRPNVRQVGRRRPDFFQIDHIIDDEDRSESETGAITNDSPFLARAVGSVASKPSVSPKMFEEVVEGVSDGPLPNSSNDPFDSRESIESISNHFDPPSSQEDFSDERCHHEYPSSRDSEQSQCNYQSSSSGYSQSSVENC